MITAVPAAPTIATCSTTCSWNRPSRRCRSPRYTFNMPAHRQCHASARPLRAWDPAYLNGLQNLQALVAGTNNGQEVDMLNNNLKTPYSDQFSLGMSQQARRLADRRRPSRASSATTASRSRWATAIPNGDVLPGRAASLGQRHPGLRQPDHRQQRHPRRAPPRCCCRPTSRTRRSRAGAPTSRTPTPMQAEPRHQRALLVRRSDDRATIRSSTPTPRPSIASSPPARWTARGASRLSAKLTLATPIPHNDIACYGQHVLAHGEQSLHADRRRRRAARKFLVGGKICGYRDIDFQATKDFDHRQRA